ncbi:flippase [Colwellia sp. 1_MG-2023]|uniref:flippase n=1 Tax=Colwellia sp. 1_MG-2023 TaxID=3062649 RepID=UPI0026E2C48E|nr:flippase [Colwellia sp. 1_MG-2023]MDO6444325.1 flippase [Colwellia sp. 1_MG-2023]
MAVSASIKNSALLILEKTLTIGIAFITGVFLARIAGPQLFGEYAYILSFAGLFAPLCMMGLNNITSKYVIKYPINSHHYVKSALIIRAFGALLSVLLGLFCVLNFNENNSANSLTIQLLILQSFQFLYVIEYYFLANNLVNTTLKIRLFILMLSSLLKIIVIFNGADITLLIKVHGGAYAFIALSYLWFYRVKNAHLILKKQVNSHAIFALFHRGKWLLLSGIAAVIYLKIDQVMLGQYYNNKEVGIYAAAARLSEFWYVFPVLIANAFNRQLHDKFKQSHKDFTLFLQSILAVLIVSAVIISILTYVLSPIVLLWIYGEEFIKSAAILNIHIFATLFIFQRAIFSKWLIIKGLYKYSLLTHGVGAISNVILNIYFIPKWGGIGAAWATLISYVFASFISLFFSKATRPFAFIMLQATFVQTFKLRSSIKLIKNSQKPSQLI